MGGATGWRQQIRGEDWMRDMEKRVLHEERRPNIRTASDLLGPGIGPYSVYLDDWNADETAFNGFFHSEPGALNAPKTDRHWMGTSQSTADGFGLQRVTEYRGDTTDDITWPRPVYLRKFFNGGVGTQRQFSLWRVEDGAPPGLIAEFGAAGSAPSGWLVCNGALRDRVDYPDLFLVIGTAFNTGGEPVTQFRVPNTAGKVIKA